MAAIRFSADFLPIRSSWATSSSFRKYRSPGVFTSPAFTRFSTTAMPRPSMSMASRETKCKTPSRSCAGQTRPPVQRATASPSRRSIFEPHSGHTAGKTMSLASSGTRFSSTTPETWGITSPARRTITVSLSLSPRRLISSSL